MREIYAYDIEMLSNLFTVIFVNVRDESDKKTFYIGLDKFNLAPLKEFLNKPINLVGYNNFSYDDPMLRYLLAYKGSGGNLIPNLYSLSTKLVDNNYRSDRTILRLRYPRNTKYSWNSMDLMKMLAFDKLGVSLKQISINLKWHMIQDMPIHHSAKVTLKELPMILSYNLNDVLITKKLYEETEPIRKLRTDLSELYKVDLTSASDSKMANILLEKFYAEKAKVDIRSIKDLRTVRTKVLLGNCLADFVDFKTPQLREMLDRISATYVYSYNNYRYAEKINFANCTFSLGVGGLHSTDAPGKFITDSEYIIQDMDVASYYPNLIINNKFYPEHLGETFIDVLKDLTEERIQAKHSGDKVKASGLKITINSIFGKLGSETFWLLDAKQMLSTTLSGQMGLLMLIEDLHLAGIPVISCNTDGVVCQIPRNKLDSYYQIAKEWEEKTSLELEYTQYKKYVRRDVNSYITEKDDGHTKEKGAFVKDISLKKSYKMPIVPKALHAYFIEGKPVRETLEECKDIMEFCISQKTGGKFKVELHTTDGIINLQKTNRFFISSKGGGALLKRNTFTNKTTGLYVGHTVAILNDFDSEKPFEDYNVNLAFYESEVMKIIDEVEPKQMNLFDLTAVDFGVKTKMEFEPINTRTKREKMFQEDVYSFAFVDSLGKNQAGVIIQDAGENGKKISGISPRYAYVRNFYSNNMVADLYCLSKGVLQSVIIDKKAYRKNGLKRGDLVFCSKFKKKGKDFYLVDYKIEEVLEKEEDSLF